MKNGSLVSLLKEYRGKILERERTNRRSIHLYKTGGDWVSFEKSAYQLMQLSSSCVLFPMSFDGDPFPLVMASLPDRLLRPLLSRYPLKRDERDYKELSVPSLSLSAYRTWYKEEVEECLL